MKSVALASILSCLALACVEDVAEQEAEGCGDAWWCVDMGAADVGVADAAPDLAVDQGVWVPDAAASETGWTQRWTGSAGSKFSGIAFEVRSGGSVVCRVNYRFAGARYVDDCAECAFAMEARLARIHRDERTEHCEAGVGLDGMTTALGKRATSEPGPAEVLMRVEGAWVVVPGSQSWGSDALRSWAFDMPTAPEGEWRPVVGALVGEFGADGYGRLSVRFADAEHPDFLLCEVGADATLAPVPACPECAASWRVTSGRAFPGIYGGISDCNAHTGLIADPLDIGHSPPSTLHVRSGSDWSSYPEASRLEAGGLHFQMPLE